MWPPILVLLSLIINNKNVEAFSAVRPGTATVVNQGFDDFLTDAPQEVNQWKKLDIKGTIPSYLRGTLMRNGPAMWTAGESEEEKEILTHIFDGIAKYSSYRISGGTQDQDDDNDDNDDKKEPPTVEFQNRFIQSKYYQQVMEEKKIPPMIYVGPVVSLKTGQSRRIGWRYVLKSIANSVKFDNASVNIWDYDPAQRQKSAVTGDGGKEYDRSVTAISDAPSRAELSLENAETLDTSPNARERIQGVKAFKIFESAHPSYSLTSEDTYNVVVAITSSGPTVVIVKESPLRSREMVGKCAIDDGVPYVHSMEVTRNHAIVVLNPLRMNPNPKETAKLGLLQSFVQVDQTRVLIFDLETGECVMNQATDEKVFHYHSISAIEYDNEDGELEISIRLCAYKDHNFISGENHFLRIHECLGDKEARKRISHNSKFCDVVCNLKRGTVQVDWNDLGQTFELPTTRYSRCYGANAETPASRHPKYVYGAGPFADGPEGEYDSYGVFKFNPDDKKIVATFRRESLYPTEPIFVANPDSHGDDDREDDGVVLVQGYDGIRRETALFVLDATNMKVIAELWTGHVTPHDFHGTWIPE